ncbi:MAG: tRNA glutamyl-Q(34) synthetase GluQRS [Pseudomonadota bacterium]
MTFVTRFAPSPTGPLHIGHAYSACIAASRAGTAQGVFHLRFEDLDRARVRPEWYTLIEDDLAWLGLTWTIPPLRQSQHVSRYGAALDQLMALGLVYPCSCTRADIQAAGVAPQEGATYGPIYPGTCRGRSMDDRKPGDALRLNIGKAAQQIGAFSFVDTGPVRPGTHLVTPEDLSCRTGDVVLSRRSTDEIAYLLASALDDAYQGVSEVIRGSDLVDFTPVQVLLLKLWGCDVPTYHHHALIRDSAGKRLAKRDDARAISTYRAEGATPADIRRMVGL